MNKKPVSYLQIDARWKFADYSARGEKTTIGASGCGPTAMSMVLAEWADPKVTPLTECRWALAHGFKAPKSGTYYSYFVPAARRYGLACTQLNSASIYGSGGSGLHAQVLAALAQGDLIIACMGKGNWTSSGHYVLLWDVDPGKDIAYVNDPASTLARRTRGSWKLFKTQVKFYWRIRRPATAVSAAPAVEKEVTMSADEIRKLIEETVKVTLKNALPGAVAKVLSDLGKEPEPQWSVDEGRWEDARERGLTDGTRPCSLASRAEVMALISRAMEAVEKANAEAMEEASEEMEERLRALREAMEDAGMD